MRELSALKMTIDVDDDRQMYIFISNGNVLLPKVSKGGY